MAMGTGRGGHGPSEVTSRIGGDRPGCDFMITTLGELRADTGTTERGYQAPRGGERCSTNSSGATVWRYRPFAARPMPPELCRYVNRTMASNIGVHSRPRNLDR
jgi:hypothetical protein